jgi:hypothetical protein
MPGVSARLQRIVNTRWIKISTMLNPFDYDFQSLSDVKLMRNLLTFSSLIEPQIQAQQRIYGF